MAKTRKSSAPSTDVEPEAIDEQMFEVRVGRVVRAAGTTFRPMYKYKVRSRVLAELGDAVTSSTPVN